MGHFFFTFISFLFLSFCFSEFTSTRPEQLHLAFAGADINGYPNGMSVSWFTHQFTSSVVQYGLDADKLDQVSKGSSMQYLVEYGYHHRVVLSNLVANSVYYYRVGNHSIWSDVFHFRAAPNSPDALLSISVFGDLGYLDSKQRPMEVVFSYLEKDWSAMETRRQIEKLHSVGAIDFIWHIGDISYADDSFDSSPESFTYEDVYNGYMRWFENISNTIPYMVLPGNHETECHSPSCLYGVRGASLKNFSAYNARWHMPSDVSGGVLSMWYSFNYGAVHFVSINTETDWVNAQEETGGLPNSYYKCGSFGRTGEYMAWLEEDLKKAVKEREAGLRPWIIVGGHRPFDHVCNTDSQNPPIEDLLNKYDVDLYICGHLHSYCRFGPAYKGKVDTGSVVSPNHYHKPKNLVSIIVGGPGCDEMKNILSLDGNSSAQPVISGVKASVLEGEQFSSNKMASGVLEVNSTSLHWKLLDSSDGTILDEFWITK